jgi:rubrerythrin
MTSSINDIAAIITKAIEVEKNGLQTYLKFARETEEVSGKNMFILMANDEFDHMNLLEGMLKEIAKKEGGFVPEDVDLSIIEKIVPKLRKKDRLTVGKAGADELVALKAARDMERNAIEYYQKLHDSLTDQKMRKIVQRLVEMEEGHYDIIQMQIDSVTNTGFWFDMAEFSLEM